MKQRKQMSKTDIEFCNIISFIIAIIYLIASVALIFLGKTAEYRNFYDYTYLIVFFYIIGIIFNYKARNNKYSVMFNNIKMIIYDIDFLFLFLLFFFGMIASCTIQG